MICGAEDLVAVCKRKIAPTPHTLSADGKFSWEEVECLGACANAPMAQIGKDYYEDLTPESLEALIDRMSAGEVPVPGSQTGRFASEPVSGLTSLADLKGQEGHNASVQLASDLGETLKRIDGTEVPILTKWRRKPDAAADDQTGVDTAPEREPRPSDGAPVDSTGVTEQEAQASSAARPVSAREPADVRKDDKDRD